MCPTTARLSCALLRAGALRVTACFRSPLTPSSGLSSGLYPGRWNTSISASRPANQARTLAERWTGRRSRMRKTFWPASRARRARKRSRLGALTAPSSTIQRSSPLFVTAVCHGRDQAEAGPLVVDPHLRRAAPGRVAAAAHVVRAQAGLIPPEDRAALGLGPRRNGRVVAPQPAPHRGRVLLVGAPQRLLGGE